MQLEKTVILNFVLEDVKFVSISQNEDFICDNNGANFISFLMRSGKVEFLIQSNLIYTSLRANFVSSLLLFIDTS
jgi:hypothetical protein